MEALIKQEVVGAKKEVLDRHQMKAEPVNPATGPLREVILTWKDTTKATVNI